MVTFPLLAFFREKILSDPKLHPFDKQLYVTVATVAFYGSFRLGELLSKAATSFDPSTTLLGSDIEFIPAGSKPGITKNMFTIKVKSPKVTRVAAGTPFPSSHSNTIQQSSSTTQSQS